jgi:hypothetical protein
MKRICHSCGSYPSETPFPTRGWRCSDCTAEAERIQSTRTWKVMTRASYRAALRHRQTLAQFDLVDMLVHTP